MKTKYRQRNTEPKTWHFEKLCPNWPSADYTEAPEVPMADLCEACVELRARELIWKFIGPADDSSRPTN